MPVEFRLRELTTADANFVLHSWKQSLRDWGPLAILRDYAKYYGTYNKPIEVIFGACRTLVACAPDNPDAILGWACTDEARGLLHYVYVKEPYRRMGIAKALIEQTPKARAATHWSKAAEEAGPRHGISYRPSKIYPEPKEIYRDQHQTRPAS